MIAGDLRKRRDSHHCIVTHFLILICQRADEIRQRICAYHVSHCTYGPTANLYVRRVTKGRHTGQSARVLQAIVK